jgi:hypothetical protein
MEYRFTFLISQNTRGPLLTGACRPLITTMVQPKSRKSLTLSEMTAGKKVVCASDIR